MSLWLIRAGAHGEFESKFIADQKVYITWDRLALDLGRQPSREALQAELAVIYNESLPARLRNWVAQLWPFAHTMKKGDWIVLPSKTQQTIYIGEITGEYHYDPKAEEPYRHSRTVKWIGEAIPRTHFGKDLLFSFGAFLTICAIKRNHAEERLKAMKANGWKLDPGWKAAATTASASPTPTKTPALSVNADGDEEADSEAGRPIDLEQEGLDRIAMLIQAKFAGHGLTRLVESILKAQGYTTYRSPEGADGGADILAGQGTLGFGLPQLCVEVKSQDSPVDRPTVDKLLGAMSKFNAAQGLFVSWGGFKTNVQKELAQSFFKVRLWTRKDLLDALFAHYDQLDAEIKAELPLKRIWTVAVPEGG